MVLVSLKDQLHVAEQADYLTHLCASTAASGHLNHMRDPPKLNPGTCPLEQVETVLQASSARSVGLKDICSVCSVPSATEVHKWGKCDWGPNRRGFKLIDLETAVPLACNHA